ncbi:MAG: 30S ribosomal protein S1 [Myxococcales bacterium]|nr:MAG: 30S ribosomal protein S1 [Myxococcales bacterium]
MTPETTLQKPVADSEDFASMFEASLQTRDLKEGDMVRGRVLYIGKDTALIDIGYKSEGLVDLQEFRDAAGALIVNVGDEVDVILEEIEDDHGQIVLSKEKADRQKVWDEICEKCERDELVEGTIVARIKGGLAVDIGVKAFLPGSQVDLRPVRNLDKLIGQKFQFKVIKFNKKRGNIVLSRRALLEKEREALKSKTLENLQEGMVVTGIIKNITNYGAFVDLGGIDGLLHITDMSWGRVNHPSEMFSIGDEVKVKVLKFDQGNERVSLGLKQMTPDPWEQATERYPVNQKVSGKVVSLTDYGAFVELEQGIEGLIHVSEMSWTKRVKHPSKLVSVGDEVEVIILDIDIANRRISLGMKQVEPNPWTMLIEKYPKGTVIQGKIRNITDFGVFIGVEEGIDGLVHISDISWTQKVKHPSELYKKGQEVEAVVLNIDPEKERFSLGIKQLVPDPWKRIPDKYYPGMVVSGHISKVTDFGAFMEIEDGVEGLIHVSELANERIEDPSTVVKEGQEVKAEIKHIDPVDRKIALSIRSLLNNQEKLHMSEFMNVGQSSTTNLGEAIKEKLKLRDAEPAPGDGETPTPEAEKEEKPEKEKQDNA